MNGSNMTDLLQAILDDDVPRSTALLREHPSLRAELNGSSCGHPPALVAARSRAMVDWLLGEGAELGPVSRWWAAGFYLGKVDPDVAEYLLDRGAEATVHAVAGLGLADRLVRMLDAQPELVHARGGDGGRPLHFARTLEVAQVLLERGAEIDAIDDDHQSTAAQWRIEDAPEVTRFLLEHGAAPDIFMAVALAEDELIGDSLIHSLLTSNPECTTYRIGNNSGPFPGIGFQGRGGTIYQWTLGFNLAPQELALRRGKRLVYQLLMAHTPPRHQLLVACMLADRELAERIVADDPFILADCDDEDRALLAKSCWETNLNPAAVRLMLDLGFPVAATESNHGYSPLHNAAWCGCDELVELLIERGHPVGLRDPTHGGTAISWALHSCLEARRHPDADFARVIDRLLRAGTPWDPSAYPTGHSQIDAVLAAQLGRAHL